MVERAFLVASFVLICAFVAILAWNLHVRQEFAVNGETYISCLHAQILKAISAATTTDPLTALVLVSEAKTCIELLSKFTGGDSCLSRISGIDVTRVNNTITFQERQIRKHLPANNELHSFTTS